MRRSLERISDVSLIPTGYERILPPNMQMAVYSARRVVARRLTGRVLDLGGADSHLTMHQRASIERCVVLDGPDDPQLQSLADDNDRFDHVVAVCALSRASDIDATLVAITNVLDSGGRLHFVEPIATSPRAHTFSRFARPVVRAASGFHLDRNVVQTIRSSFTICDIHRDRPAAWSWPYQHVAWGSARHPLPASPIGA